LRFDVVGGSRSNLLIDELAISGVWQAGGETEQRVER
jgi:hypothetical protein